MVGPVMGMRPHMLPHMPHMLLQLPPQPPPLLLLLSVAVRLVL
jgi:hypothetical protein